MSLPAAAHAATWLTDEDCHLEDFQALVEQVTDLRQYPEARAAESNILIYDAGHVRQRAATGQGRRQLQAELARALMDGPGVVVIEGAFATPVVDEATRVFTALIDEEIAAGRSRGDHFAKPGTNARLWDSLGKLARRAPEVWVDYFANDVVDLVSTAWLGPGYQVTTQVNLVNPGGVAQAVHRDYHLGFMTNERAAAFPAHVHLLSPVLTLQGAVAHSDMPVESGPTMYVPYSHKYLPGYLAWRLPQFRSYTDDHYVQPALVRGDAAFFNPAVFHAAGTNKSADVRRMANLFQVSSPFGRAMETMDRAAVTDAVYPVLLQRKREGATEGWLRNAIAACAEGYSFPTNLDLDIPLDGLAPAPPVDIVWQALQQDWAPDKLRLALQSAAERRRT